MTQRRKLGPARRRAMLFTALAVALTVLVPPAVAIMLHREYLHWEAERATEAFAQNLAWRAREVFLHAERELDRLVERTGGRCTPENIHVMLDTAYRAIVVREAGIFAGGRLLCTSWGPLADPPVIPGGNDRVVPGERVIIPSVTSLLGLSGRSTALNMSADEDGTVGVNVLVPRETLTAGLAPGGGANSTMRAAIWVADGVLGVANMSEAQAAQLTVAPVEAVFPSRDFIVRTAVAMEGMQVAVVHDREGLWRASLGLAAPTALVALVAAILSFVLHQAAARRRFAPMAEFAIALADRELVYDCEPIVRLDDGRPAGFEMLARWQHPIHGRLTPDRFLTALEAPRLATPLLLYALDRAIDLIGRAGIPGYASINITAAALDDLRWLDAATDRLAAAGRLPADIQFELTERQPLNLRDPARQAALWRIRAAGFRLALDDFGTGTNGLDALALGRFDQVKIDRGFIVAMRMDPRAEIIVVTMATLAGQLATEIVGEGIERDDQVGPILAAGITLGQGWLFPGVKGAA